MSFDSYTKQGRKSNKNYIAVLRIFRLLCKKFFFHSYIGLVRKRVRKTSNFYSHCIEFLKNCSYSIFLEHCIGIVKTKSNYGGPSQISIAIPQLNDVNPESKSWKSVELLTDVLLSVESNVEFLSCYAFLRNVFKSRINEVGHVYFGEIGEGQKKVTFSLVRASRGSSQVSAAQNVVRTAVVALKPKAVFSVGCCAGLRREQAQLGDVVISGKLSNCGDKHIIDEKLQWDSRRLDVSAKIRHLIKSAADGWRPPLKDPEARDVKVHGNAEILSGAEFVNSPDEHKQLLHQFPEAVASESEVQGECY